MNEKEICILLLGAAGQVGSECKKIFQQAGCVVISITRRELDFSSINSADEMFDVLSGFQTPTIIVNAVAYTAVDKAESELSLADKVNHTCVGFLAQYCAVHTVPLIHISTDYVFDGTAAKPYVESDRVNPLGVYGQTKLLGEQVVESTLSQHIILRTSWVFGVSGSNFVKTILRLSAEKEQLTIVSDQYGCPTYANDIAAAILCIIQRYASGESLEWGVYHCVGEEEVSWYEFSRGIVNEAYVRGLISNKPQILPIPTSAYPTPAARPAYSVLNTDKLARHLNYSVPSWRQSLSAFFDEYSSVL